MFKDTKEGQTHSFNDGCGEPQHNDMTTMNPITQTIKEREDVLEEIIEKLAMAITHSEQGEYIKNEKFVREIIPTAHITQTNIALLESVVGVVESMEGITIENRDGTKTELLNKQDILTELQEALKELKDNEKEV